MAPGTEKAHGSFADRYDELCRSMECHAPEVLFGLAYEYVLPGQKLLDLGIGTGLCASLFHKAGLEVYGADFSGDMVRECEKKGVATELKILDISKAPWPYADSQFHHAISGGVFHFIRDLEGVFGEARRVLKPEATFSFTVKGDGQRRVVYVDAGSGIEIFCQSEAEIGGLLQTHGFSLLKRLQFFTYDDLEKKVKSPFTAYVGRKER